MMGYLDNRQPIYKKRDVHNGKKQTHSIYYDDIKSCAYYSKGYCMLRDDTCKPSSLKCKKILI